MAERHPTHRKRLRNSASHFGVLALLLTACSAGSNSPHPAGSTPGDATTASGSNVDAVAELLHVTTTGGRCPQGVCSVTVDVSRGGAWVRQENVKRTTGTLSKAEADQFAAMIDAEISTLETLPSKPTRSCPSASDGQDRIYRFTSRAKRAEVSNCDVNLAGGHALL